MIWDRLTSIQISKLNKNIPVLLVLSATEQHGPHLPLATDRLIGEFFSNKLNEVIPDRILILPIVSVGCSFHHMDFPGTLSLRHDSFNNQVRDIIDSVLKHGFQKVVLLNSHGGNQASAQALIEKLGYQYPEAHFVIATWWRIALERLSQITETGVGGVGHAGEFETSLILLIAPDLVLKENISPKSNISTFPWAEGDMLRGGNTFYYRSMKEMTTNGVFGDASAASREKGIEITEAVISALEQLVTDLFHLK